MPVCRAVAAQDVRQFQRTNSALKNQCCKNGGNHRFTSSTLVRSLNRTIREDVPTPPPPTISFHKRFLSHKNEPVLARPVGAIYRYIRVAAVSCRLVSDPHDPLPLHPEAKIDHVQSHQEEPVGDSGCRYHP